MPIRSYEQLERYEAKRDIRKSGTMWGSFSHMSNQDDTRTWNLYGQLERDEGSSIIWTLLKPWSQYSLRSHMSNQDGMRPTGLYQQPKQYVAHEIIRVLERMWSQQGCLSSIQEFMWVLQLIRDPEIAINGFAESQDFDTANMSIRARIPLRCKRDTSGTNFRRRCI